VSAGSLVLGLDFGTDSVRTVVVDARDGRTVGVAVTAYPRWTRGLYCDAVAHRFRQHPLDYLESMESSIRAALADAGPGTAAQIRGIAVDTTGSTPVLADAAGRPLALTAGFEDDPDAMFVLWKDHTSVAEAAEINQLARTWGGIDYTRFEGGVYSSEWFWAKALHILKANGAAGRAAVTVLEHCDWVPMVLTGTSDLRKVKRSRCAAGHKAMWHASFDGYPSDEFLARLHPRLPALKATFGSQTHTAETAFGTLAPDWAKRLGLSEDVVVSVGAFDAHMGAVGGNIRPYQIVKVMGTSTCDVMIAPASAPGSANEQLVAGICGQVDGSVVAGAIGYEAGQSAFGDVYAWFKDLLSWPLEAILPSLPGMAPGAAASLAQSIADRIIPELEKAARAVPPSASGVLALDWLNGRRTPDADQRLKGAIAGLDLGSDAPRVYRALVEATAYGARAIVERFRSQGVRIDGAIAIGGIPRKSPFVMQVMADVLNLAIEVPSAEQPVALGAAMFAATAAGLYPRVEDAQRAMAAPVEITYHPDPERATLYTTLYRDYLALGSFVEKQLTARPT
jgi:L-ribulokinase